MAIGHIKIGVSVGVKGLNSGLASARKSLAGVTSFLNPLSGGIGAVTAKIGALTGGALALSAVWSKTMDQMGRIDQISKDARKLNITTEALIGIEHAAGLAGVETDLLRNSVSKMTKNIADAATTGGTAASALNTLGIDLQEIATLPADKQLGMIADGLNNVQSQGEKISLAQDLFGKGGGDLLELLASGSAGLEQAAERAKELGISFSDLDAVQVEMANDAISELQTFVSGLYQQMAIQLAPIITTVAKYFTDAAISGLDFSEIVTTGIEWVVTAIGTAADVIDLIKIGFDFLQAGATKAIAVVVQGLAWLGKGLEELINLIPGVEVEFGDTLQNIADDLDVLASEQFAKAKKEFLAPPPSEKFNQFFQDVKKENAKAAEELRKKSLGKAIEGDFANTEKVAADAIGKLKDEILQIQIGDDAFERHKLSLQGVNAETLKEVEALQKEKKALQDSKKHFDDLRQSADNLNSSDPITKFKSSLSELQEMLSEGLITQDVFNAAALDALPDKVKKIMEESKTPLEQFNESLTELMQFHLEGLITDEQFTKAKNKLQKDVFGDPSKLELGTQAELGSSEARSSILRNRLGTLSPQKDLLNVQKKNLEYASKLPPLLAEANKLAKKKETLFLPPA